jgi:cyclopropane fatty-acyl-phospholipid synthase-like methyltransferase
VNEAERPSTAAEEGPAWSSTAELWDEHWARLADPARGVVLEQAAVGPGTRFLDMGCGTGELCALAGARP